MKTKEVVKHRSGRSVSLDIVRAASSGTQTNFTFYCNEQQGALSAWKALKQGKMDEDMTFMDLRHAADVLVGRDKYRMSDLRAAIDYINPSKSGLISFHDFNAFFMRPHAKQETTSSQLLHTPEPLVGNLRLSDLILKYSEIPAAKPTELLSAPPHDDPSRVPARSLSYSVGCKPSPMILEALQKLNNIYENDEMDLAAEKNARFSKLMQKLLHLPDGKEKDLLKEQLHKNDGEASAQVWSSHLSRAASMSQKQPQGTLGKSKSLSSRASHEITVRDNFGGSRRPINQTITSPQGSLIASRARNELNVFSSFGATIRRASHGATRANLSWNEPSDLPLPESTQSVHLNMADGRAHETAAATAAPLEALAEVDGIPEDSCKILQLEQQQLVCGEGEDGYPLPSSGCGKVRWYTISSGLRKITESKKIKAKWPGLDGEDDSEDEVAEKKHRSIFASNFKHRVEDNLLSGKAKFGFSDAVLAACATKGPMAVSDITPGIMSMPFLKGDPPETLNEAEGDANKSPPSLKHPCENFDTIQHHGQKTTSLTHAYSDRVQHKALLQDNVDSISVPVSPTPPHTPSPPIRRVI